MKPNINKYSYVHNYKYQSIKDLVIQATLYISETVAIHTHVHSFSNTFS